MVSEGGVGGRTFEKKNNRSAVVKLVFTFTERERERERENNIIYI